MARTTKLSGFRARRVARQWSLAILAVTVATGLLSLGPAPATAAIGLAGCLRATGSYVQGAISYLVVISNSCAFDGGTSARISYDVRIPFGFPCATASGSLNRSWMSATVLLTTDCLSPGTHTPEVTFSSREDGSYNRQILPMITIKAPTATMSPAASPSAPPTVTSAPTAAAPSRQATATHCISPGSGGMKCLPGWEWSYVKCMKGEDLSGTVLQQRREDAWIDIVKNVAVKNGCSAKFPWTVAVTRMNATSGRCEFRFKFPKDRGKSQFVYFTLDAF